MKIRHARLLNVFGRPASQGGYAIVPAEVKLAGTMFSTTFPLAELPTELIPPILRLPIERHYDVSWVRARLPFAFGITPEPSETEKTLLCAGFVAVAEGEQEGLAFECCDYYGRTALMFSEDEADLAAKEKVAQAFWGVLLSEPNLLDDFEASVSHLGAGVTLHFGCRDGEPFCEESPE